MVWCDVIVRVAQLVERGSEVPQVAGSTPAPNTGDLPKGRVREGRVREGRECRRGGGVRVRSGR